MAVLIFNGIPQLEEVSDKIFAKLYSENGLIEKGVAFQIEGVKGSYTFRKVDGTLVFKDPSAKFNPEVTSQSEINGKTITPVAMEHHEEIELDEAFRLVNKPPIKNGSWNDYANPEIMSAIVASKLTLAKKLIGKLCIQGKASDTSFTFTDAFVGLVAEGVADADVAQYKISPVITITGLALGASTVITHASGENDDLKIGDQLTFQDNVGGTVQIRGLSGAITAKSPTTTTVAINSTGFTAWTSGGTIVSIYQANVIEVLQNMVTATPDAIKENGGFLVTSTRVLDLYVSALGNVNSLNPMDGKQAMVNGYPIKALTDFPANVVFMTHPNNIGIVTDDQDDESTIEVIWGGTGEANKTYTLRMRLKIGITYVEPTEMIMLKPSKA